MNRGRLAQLWGGPEDGAQVWMPPGELPKLVGVQRMPDGALVPIRGRGALLEEQVAVYRGQIQVYEHPDGSSHVPSVTMARSLLAIDMRAPLYVHRDVLTRWAARGDV